MDTNSELLTYIHVNSEMGKNMLNQLIGITKDNDFKSLLQSQYNEYNMINSISEQKLSSRNKEAMNVNPFDKLAVYISINLNTLANAKPSHISEILIKGSTTGIIDITKKINDYTSTADPEVLDLANRLLSFEQSNIEECKKYL
ncbi:hypothetical protein SAMN02745823_03622 [Sporobacter termitidis DSM 10068]|uniref:DUF2383 domain-containing protein n=1 Tax=Sporobacter termitidis DSM 10068 TaxID=1123282 RepID=A0A1M5ZES9_9FIRM|nr:hypothetical protein [Sporobacter termitidis]SHI22669.1 hypothetical protein SAMN02745823_03622 [Sporobacter termitidis DSM 10068]